MAASGAGWRRHLRFLRPDLRADFRDEMDEAVWLNAL
jgi:hypothetical protein